MSASDSVGVECSRGPISVLARAPGVSRTGIQAAAAAKASGQRASVVLGGYEQPNGRRRRRRAGVIIGAAAREDGEARVISRDEVGEGRARAAALSVVGFSAAPRLQMRVPDLEHALQFFDGALQLVVDDVVVERRRAIGGMREGEFGLGVAQALLDLVLGLGAAAAQALLEDVERRRFHPQVIRLERRRRLDLAHALDVDVEDADATLLLHGLDGRFRGAVVVPVHVRRLDEAAALYLGLHRLDLGEVVVHAIRLPRTRVARRVRHREPERRRLPLHQLPDQRALARARASGNDERGIDGGGHPHAREPVVCFPTTQKTTSA
eukprot:CAMPEP_0185701548 /NCGR_PEP_ID=MMETSP1164-20130828/9700_1 /TAXON_ID=1104430 /ORGANISM="Chrysoreinhardia sp, Strain CCMP2950" /LENGTH=322 /DNA_ID=CAMNT_0028368617 /DNA_START=196 /DNA_END=1162 /DNA_ORIENTATION=+